MSDPFASAQDLAQHLNVALPDDLARMQQLLSEASALIRRQAGQTLSPVAADVVTVEPVADNTLLLPERPVTAITSVVIGAVTVPSGNYRFDSKRGYLVRVDLHWWDGWETPSAINPVYTVNYDHGFVESSDTYANIKTICMKAAARAYAPTEVLGSTVVESAGYAPAVFLTEDEKMQLSFGKAYV